MDTRHATSRYKRFTIFSKLRLMKQVRHGRNYPANSDKSRDRKHIRPQSVLRRNAFRNSHALLQARLVSVPSLNAALPRSFSGLDSVLPVRRAPLHFQAPTIVLCMSALQTILQRMAMARIPIMAFTHRDGFGGQRLHSHEKKYRYNRKTLCIHFELSEMWAIAIWDSANTAWQRRPIEASLAPRKFNHLTYINF